MAYSNIEKIKIKIKRFFLHLFSKEMVVSWILFVVFILVFNAINYLFVPLKWLLVDNFILASLLFIYFVSDFLLTLKSKQFQKEKNYTKGIIFDLLDAVVAYDKDFIITVFNPAAETMFNIKKEDILGKPISPALISNPKYTLLIQTIFPSLAPIIKEKKINGYQEEYNIVFEDPYREFHVSFNRIVNEKNKPIGFVKVIHDITREQELIKEKSEFLDIAAHNLNTPITEIRWGLETLLGEAKDDKNLLKYTEILNHLGEVSKSLADLVDDLLSVTRIEKGKFGYSFKEEDIVSLVEKNLEKWAPIVRRNSLKLYFERPKEILPKVYIDPTRIRIVLDNLVENAMVYNVKNGEITVKIEKVPQKPFIVISVKDTGIGIADDEKDKVFQKLFRSRDAVKYRTQGIGLGLYISKNIIRRHGGEMWFESVKDRGSIFYFSLPTKKELVPLLEVPIL